MNMMRNALILLAARAFHLLESPAMTLDPAQERAFAELATAVVAGGGGIVDYELPYPKHEFLRYLVEKHGVFLHGTNDPAIPRLVPRPQTLFRGGGAIEAVFATPDDIWCMFYAIVNNAGFSGSKRNGCVRATGRGGRVRKFYWFSLSRPMLVRPEAFCDGYVYILPGATFGPTAVPDEWVSPEPVAPLAKLPIRPDDFPFFDEIGAHDDSDSHLRFFSRMLRGRSRNV